MASSIIPLTEVPTIALLYKLKHLIPAASPAVSTPSQPFNDTICHITCDITKLEVDCIVNAANSSLLGGGGVDGAIHRLAGPNLVRECRTLGGCATGDAKITDAYRLPCRKIVHTVGPVYWTEEERKPGQAEALLQSCYARSLEVAVSSGLRSIAFSSISTGIYGYPSMKAAEVALRTVRNFLGSNPQVLDRVIFCTFEKKDERAYQTLIPEYFPPTEQDLSQSSSKEQPTNPPEPEATSLSASETLAAKLPDPPTVDPATEGQPGTKKQKTGSDPAESRSASRDDERSEDGWERVERTEKPAGDSLDDDPVELHAPSAADVQSVVSSTADLEESASLEGKQRK
ncbi:hypothetical protein AJ80_02879 [Polytolypa hystricis UAMH7299]|uniref:Macro domain-containing protein n=1 Tax=Polytolypa hystricis (strain UAMH7299) TaxID=1447883 RepID=A0A2B7YP71_POLH7|nr:hypothetical protein AJ80_02879 [Polytolypa hystricis UAMH7299]